MAYDYFELLQQAKLAVTQAQREAWLNSDALTALNDLEQPSHLFANSPTRPLVVAFMGGTGVGKSALLNRLAGQAIAKSSIERPTSREVTLFYHQQLTLPALAEQLPLTKINLAQHHDDAKQNIVWLDMPDFDSTELNNKQQVLSWLPHIDVLCYVVSPERYRDDKAWRLLLAEGEKHAWLFVFNQWDNAQAVQLDDFTQQLHKAGFLQPVMFKTSCLNDGINDDFSDLQQLLMQLATENSATQLQQRNLQLCKQQLAQCLENLVQQLGDSQHLRTHWQRIWQHSQQQIQQGMTWAIHALAQQYSNSAQVLTQQPNITLWDDWSQTCFDDALNELLNQANAQQLPISPLKQQLHALRSTAKAQSNKHIALSLRLALAQQGKKWQRGLLMALKLCEVALPLLAMAWVSVQVFIGYYQSNQHTAPYLGVDFAVHSVLLIALTWLIPFFLIKKCQPSLKNIALRGLQSGITQALNALDTEVMTVLSNIELQHKTHSTQLHALSTACHEGSQSKPSESLARLLLNQAKTER